MERPLYQELAKSIQARQSCNESNNQEWFKKHTETILTLVHNHFSSEWHLDLDATHADKLVFVGSFHHMNDTGYWDGYTDHTIIVKPSLQFGFTLRITGHDRNDVKDALHQEFDIALREDVTYDLYAPHVPEFQIKHEWSYSCPFCKQENVPQDHNCDAFPGNKTTHTGKWYQPKDEHQSFHVSGIKFATLAEARKYAGELAYNAFMSQAKR